MPIELAQALAAAGISPGADGYDADALTAAAEARGLVASVEAIPGTMRHQQRFRALVWRTAERRAGLHGEVLATAHPAARGRGRTEAEALGKALVAWLRKGV